MICHYKYDLVNLSIGSNDKLIRGVFVGGILKIIRDIFSSLFELKILQ